MSNLTWGTNGAPATLADLQACVGPGWADILARLVPDLLALGWDGSVLQIKEKYGTLRFYIGSASDAVFRRIDEAEKESSTVCERCGGPGRLRGRGWVVTLCDKCDEDPNV